MRYMMLYKPGHENDGPPSAEHMAEMGRFIEQLAKEGALLLTDGLQSSAKGARVRIANGGKFTVTDGPFSEAKEQLAGVFLVDCESEDRVLEFSSILAQHAVVEVRPLMVEAGTEM
jgi:hypothetical protein